MILEIPARNLGLSMRRAGIVGGAANPLAARRPPPNRLPPGPLARADGTTPLGSDAGSRPKGTVPSAQGETLGRR